MVILFKVCVPFMIILHGNENKVYGVMSPSSRIRKPRRSHAELMKLPWRRMKVRKLEDERRSGVAMVFREALK